MYTKCYKTYQLLILTRFEYDLVKEEHLTESNLITKLDLDDSIQVDYILGLESGSLEYIAFENNDYYIAWKFQNFDVLHDIQTKMENFKYLTNMIRKFEFNSRY